jgi:phosphate starvation-inducible protein PhoH
MTEPRYSITEEQKTLISGEKETNLRKIEELYDVRIISRDTGFRVLAPHPDLSHAMAILDQAPGIAKVRLSGQEVLRHYLVQKAIAAYHQAEN